LRGAFPPIDFLELSFVRAMLLDRSWEGERERERERESGKRVEKGPDGAWMRLFVPSD
jgi:hypothetical protein